jgi:hypothetical protein
VFCRSYRCLSFCPYSFGHCVVCSCSTCGFSLPLWYLLAIVLSVLVLLVARTDNTMPKIYQRGNEKPQVQQEQTTQWPKDTKRVMRHCVVCSCWTCGFSLPLWHLQTFLIVFGLSDRVSNTRYITLQASPLTITPWMRLIWGEMWGFFCLALCILMEF